MRSILEKGILIEKELDDLTSALPLFSPLPVALKGNRLTSQPSLSALAGGGVNKGKRGEKGRDQVQGKILVQRIKSNPVSMLYFNNGNKPVLNHYLKEMSRFNMEKKGVSSYGLSYTNLVGYNFWGKSETSKLISSISKFLQSSFKSMYCLISKPVFITTPDKIKIQLFYFLCLPKFLINKTAAAFAVPVAAAAESSQAFKGKGPGKPSQALGFNSKDLDVKVNLKRLT